jgi:phage recombination protein Bet
MARPKGSKNKPKEPAMPTKTAERTSELQQYDREAESKGSVAVFQPPRLPFHQAVEDRFGVDKGTWKVIVEAIYPAAKSVDAIVLALSYCKSRNLDPMKRPVHIVPMWDSQRGGYVETVWPGISELRTTASRTKGYAGCDVAEFGPNLTMDFKGRVKRNGQWVDEVVTGLEFPEWCRITVYRIVDGQRCKFVGPKVAWLETYATQGNTELPNKMWQERPEGQLEKCAEAAALRRAFPEEIGNELTAEEMTGRHVQELVIVGEAEPVAETAARDAAPPRIPQTEEARDGSPPPRQPKQDAPPRDAAPPRQAAPKADPISTGRATTATKKAAEEVKPHRISGDGHTFESWAEKFKDLVKTSPDSATVYKWIDENTKPFTLPSDPDKKKQTGPLERLQKGKPSVYAGVRKTIEETLESLRPKQEPAKKAAPPAADMADEPDMIADMADAAEPGADEFGKPESDNPEDILKWIDKTLASVTAPEDLETVWEQECQKYTVDMIPPDQDEAAALLRKHEKRLEP